MEQVGTLNSKSFDLALYADEKIIRGEMLALDGLDRNRRDELWIRLGFPQAGATGQSHADFQHLLALWQVDDAELGEVVDAGLASGVDWESELAVDIYAQDFATEQICERVAESPAWCVDAKSAGLGLILTYLCRGALGAAEPIVACFAVYRLIDGLDENVSDELLELVGVASEWVADPFHANEYEGQAGEVVRTSLRALLRRPDIQ